MASAAGRRPQRVARPAAAAAAAAGAFTAAAGAAVYPIWLLKLIITNYLRLICNLKIRHGEIVENVVTYVYAKFVDDRLCNVM